MQRLTFPVGNRLLHFVLMGHVDFSEVIPRDTYTANITYNLICSFKIISVAGWWCVWGDDQIYSETKQPMENKKYR